MGMKTTSTSGARELDFERLPDDWQDAFARWQQTLIKKSQGAMLTDLAHPEILPEDGQVDFMAFQRTEALLRQQLLERTLWLLACHVPPHLANAIDFNAHVFRSSAVNGLTVKWKPEATNHDKKPFDKILLRFRKALGTTVIGYDQATSHRRNEVLRLPTGLGLVEALNGLRHPELAVEMEQRIIQDNLGVISDDVARTRPRL